MMDKIKYDTNFFEKYARISLIELVDKRFETLENCDRPDLQDKVRNIGIEVTRAMRENKEVAHALINEIAGRQVVDVAEEDWIDMTKYGYSYGLNDDVIGKIEYEYWAAALPMQRILENKVSKVANGFYGDFGTFGIYVFSKEDLSDSMVCSTIDFIMSLQGNNEKRYSVMYISQIQELFICDLIHASFKKKSITKSQRRRFYNHAISNQPTAL